MISANLFCDAVALIHSKIAGQENPSRPRPWPQSTDTVVPGRPWSLRASWWARAMGM